MSKLDEICRLAFIGLYTNDEDGNKVSMNDAYGVLADSLKQDIKELMLELIGNPTWSDESKNEWTRTLRRRVEEL